jgi:hypothetical protein
MTPDALAQLIVSTVKQAIQPVRAQLAALDGRLAAQATHQATIDTAAVSLAAVDIASLRERLAVLETRAPVAGPPGLNGQDGRDGADALAVSDLAASFDGDRTLTLTLSDGVRTKSVPITLPIPRWQGTYTAGHAYQTGDLVTWDGSAWHCQQPTSSKPGDHAAAWRLMVKRGRDYTRRPGTGGA